MKTDSLGMKRHERFPKEFNDWWYKEDGKDRYIGILEANDFKHECYLAWKAGRAYERKQWNDVGKIK